MSGMLIDVGALFRSHQKELQSYLRRRGASPELAADLTQEAFVRLLTAQTSVPVRHAPAYLFRTVANLSIDWARRQRLLPHVDDGDEALSYVADDAPSAERIVISRQEVEILVAALREVPPKVRYVFYARLDGMTFAEIGQRLGLSQNTVFSQMARVILLLKRCLDHARAVSGDLPGRHGR